MITLTEIENFFHIKLIQQNGRDNGAKLTVMELVLILNTCLNLCIKYCNNLKHIVSTGCHAVCKNGVSQDRLHRFQDEMLNKLPKSIDLMSVQKSVSREDLASKMYAVISYT